MLLFQLILGLLLGVFIAVIAWRAHALSRSGALAAAITGGAIFGLGGVPWAVLLLTFFISSSTLSRLFAGRKSLYNENYAKSDQRDWGQVLANGGLGLALVIIQVPFSQQMDWWAAYVGAMAAVNADTWATELGVLSPSRPRLITSGKVVERGASGGITLWGSLAALGGAFLIGFVAWLFQPGNGYSFYTALRWITVAVMAGLGGSFFDSLLGASLQAIYHCPICNRDTEKHPFHTCGGQTELVRGWRWMNNDLVNFICSLVGGGLAVCLWRLLGLWVV